MQKHQLPQLLKKTTWQTNQSDHGYLRRRSLELFANFIQNHNSKSIEDNSTFNILRYIATPEKISRVCRLVVSAEAVESWDNFPRFLPFSAGAAAGIAVL